MQTLRQIDPFASHEERVKRLNDALARNAESLRAAHLPTDNAEQILAGWGGLGYLIGGWAAGKAFGGAVAKALIPNPVPGVRIVRLPAAASSAQATAPPSPSPPAPAVASPPETTQVNQLLPEEAIAEALGELEDSVTPIGKGLRRLRARLDVDEPIAVSRGGAWDDPANKRFLESTTNQQTKSDLTEIAAQPSPTRISLRQADQAGPAAFRQAAQQMLQRPFSETDELDALTRQARQAMRNTRRPIGKLRDAINRSIRVRIRSSDDPNAVLVRRALKATNIDPDTLRARR